MNRITFFKIFEYAYLVIFFISSYEAYNTWGTNRAHLFLVFAVVSIGMFLFRRNYRKKFEKRNNSGS